MSKISIIIPVYNADKYLAECLESVMNQTFSDIEIICINDGSTDNSAEILEKHAEKDKRIKVLTQKNSGVVVARNNGIAHASADLIYPLDSDDIIAPTCLEKLYNAFISGKGDIITCKVKYFGNEDGEMILSKPSKYNMAHANCFVNAALFRKSDFDLAGGYDEKYNIALEDYDLWLNLMFNHDKTVYKVPEILFFYRQKPHEEARNWQHRDQHKDIYKTFRIKYPQITKYLLLRKVLKPFVKISRFFFRIENNKIKIFKIPVYKLRKYDCVISIGAACFVPDVMKELKIRDFSGPFDWMYGSDVETRLKIVLHKFKNYFNYEDFEYVGSNPDNGKSVYKNKRSCIVYNHDFPKGNLKDVFELIAQKYERRIERMLRHLCNDKNILFVYSELCNTGDHNKIVCLMNDINKKFSANIDLLYINHNHDIKLGKYKRIRKISKHVMYAQYHYDKFPDELAQARHVLKKLLKRCAK